MRTAHKKCVAGEWIEAAGDATTDTKCTACSTGRFRSKAPTENKAELGIAVCIIHKICKAGEWTKATGTVLADTVCVPCAAGSFREKGPTNTVAEQEARVCKPHTICASGERTKTAGTSTSDTECSARVKWKHARPGDQCDTSAGEVPLRKSSLMTSSLNQCKKSCEDTAGCQSITYFNNGWCAHFSTKCTSTRNNKKTVVAVQVARSGTTVQHQRTIT